MHSTCKGDYSYVTKTKDSDIIMLLLFLNRDPICMVKTSDG